MSIANISNTVSAASAATFSASLWVIPPADASDGLNFNDAHLINAETNDANLYNRLQCWLATALVGGVTPTRRIHLSLSNFMFDPGDKTWDFSSVANAYTPASWHHIFICGDTSVATKGYCYVNTVDKTDASSFSGNDTGFVATWNGCIFGVPTTPAEAAFHDTRIQMAEVQIWLGTFIDPTDPDNLAKFVRIVNGTGRPQNPTLAATAFGTPTYSFRGTNTQFPTNHGNGGAMSSSGVINSYTPVPGA